MVLALQSDENTSLSESAGLSNNAGLSKNTGLQLSLDLGAEVPLPAAHEPKSAKAVIKTMLFPRHIQLPHFGQIERQLKAAFTPFGIDIEFRFTRQNRLEMKWIFAPELRAETSEQPDSFNALAHLSAQLSQPSHALTEDELEAFSTMMIDFADA